MTQTIPEPNGCPWPIDPACLTDDWDALTDEVRARAVALASTTLTRLTGYRVGGCPIIVRPCKRSCMNAFLPAWERGMWMYPHINFTGAWVNSCGCTTDCSCTQVCEIVLPEPVGEVLTVQIGTDTLSPTDYRVDGNRLVWTGAGDCPWPTCQDMTAPIGAADTFAIEYLNSWPVDGLGAYAAGILAMEFAKACTGQKCRLPVSVTSVTRQGVSFEVASGAFPGGMTGIREVDTYLALWNPGGLRQRASVWSPDLPSPRVMR